MVGFPRDRDEALRNQQVGQAGLAGYVRLLPRHSQPDMIGRLSAWQARQRTMIARLDAWQADRRLEKRAKAHAWALKEAERGRQRFREMTRSDWEV